MNRRSFLRRTPKNEEMSLQITSMADIFMILLVFLLKSYSSGALTIAPSKGMQLPLASANDHAVQALKVEVSQDAILVEGKPVSRIANFTFAPADLVGNGVSKSLYSALEAERAKEAAQSPEGQARQADPRIIVVADQRTPYTTIKTVLASAATQGYTDIQLAVVNP